MTSYFNVNLLCIDHIRMLCIYGVFVYYFSYETMVLLHEMNMEFNQLPID
jgi:hypothetical protein